MNKEEFFNLYAPLAIEQQQKYGIPASVTLAQMALESSWGDGRAIKEGNNAFCVKGTYNGQFILISDNAKDEKFRKYETLAQSFEDHSRLLLKDRYRQAPGADYKAWTAGLQKGGYAYPPDGYAQKLNDIIEFNKLDERFDTMGLSPARRVDRQVVQPWEIGRFSMPLGATDGSLVMTSDIGHRDTGISGASHEHNGLDLRAKYVPVFATEMNGRVIKAENDGNSKSGKHVIVEYERDGHKFTVSYCHLSKVDVKVGDTVSAGQALGVSGNSSYRDFTKEKSLDPHLHLTVRRDGELFDPKKYLAEIAVRGGIDTTLIRKGGSGEDLLAQFKSGVVIPGGNASSVLSVSGYEIAMLSGGTKLWGDVRGNLLNIGDIGVRSQDGKYMMTAVVNGQPQEREISGEDYEKFLQSNNVERIFMFDRAYEDIAMIDAGAQQSAGSQNPYAGLFDMANGNGDQDFMSWFLNKNGDGAGLGASGDILGDLFGMVVGGLMSLQGLFNGDEEAQVQQLRDIVSARMSPDDQAKVDRMKREGVDPERAKALCQTNCEAGLTSYEQQQQQQQQVTLRG